MKNHLKNKGISIIELILVISIVLGLIAVVIPGFSSFRNQQVLKNTTEDVVSLLNQSRNNTISSKNSNTYGVHFQTDKAILFMGTTYSSLNIIKQVNFDSSVIIPATSGINLTGGGSDIVFSRITGETINNGTIVIQQINDSNQKKIISISALGIIGIN